jgi:hypothetical protein
MLGLVFTVVVLGVVMLAKWKFGKLQKTKTLLLLLLLFAKDQNGHIGS